MSVVGESPYRRWLSLPPESEPALAALRDFELQRLDAEGRIWLALPDSGELRDSGLRHDREQGLSQTLEPRLRSLPGAELFEVVGETLRPAGGRVAVRRRPEGDWRPLRETMAVSLPWSRSDSRSESAGAVALRLEPDPTPRQPDALIVSLPALARWALTAPQVRLTPLVHAVSGRRRVLVLGHPLPPLPGPRFVLRLGLLCPAGRRLAPELDELSLALLFGLTPGDLALVEPDSDHRPLEDGGGSDSSAGLRQARIPAGALKPLRRSALRLLIATHRGDADSGSGEAISEEARGESGESQESGS